MSPQLSDFAVPVTRSAGLSPWRHVLGNGVVVLGKESRKTPAVTVVLSLRSGSIGDLPDRPGAVYLLSKTLDRGTMTRSAAQIAETLEDGGATLSIVATRHLLTLTCTCLVEDFSSVLELLADIVSSPSIPDSELLIQKGEVLTQLRQDLDNPAVRAVEQLMELLYGQDHPYGQPAKGTAAIVETITREELLALHAATVAPERLSVIVVGDVGEDDAVAATRRAFGNWQHAAQPEGELPAVVAARSRRRIVIPMMNKSQVDVAYGFTTLNRADRDYYAFWLLNVALGQYAMGGRLGDSIRERQGMAYYAFSAFDANVLPGPLTVRAGVSGENVDRTIRSIDSELERVRVEGILEQELVESRQYMIGSMPRSLETNGGIASFLQTSEFFGLGLDYDVRLPDLLEQVTRADVQRLANRYLDPAHATIVIAGPYEA
jgi:zinc protease